MKMDRLDFRGGQGSVTDGEVLSVLKKTSGEIKSINLDYQNEISELLPYHICEYAFVPEIEFIVSWQQVR